MPKPKAGRTRGRHGHRVRSSSQSSVEIQVTKDEAIITTTTTATTTLASQSGSKEIPKPFMMVQPRVELLQLLKGVGAKGHQTSNGEMFSFKELCSHFTEYLKKQKLWDPYNPYIIHCQKDPLGNVFNVPSFTFWDTRQLLANNLVGKGKLPTELTQQESEKQPSGLPPCDEDNHFTDGRLTGQGDDVVSTTVPALTESTAENPSGDDGEHSHQVAPQPSSLLTVERNCAEGSAEGTACPSASTTDNTNYAETNDEEPPSQKGTKRKRGKKGDRSPASQSSDGKTVEDEDKTTEGEKRSRTRGNSISLVFSAGSGSKWWIPMVTEVESDESEILSIQSKETAYAKSSSDDIWFLDEEEVEINIETDADPPFPEEFDVESDHSSSVHSKSEQSEPSEEEQENYVLVYAESDVEFWADSESSDSESDDSTDIELTEADKWRCNHCSSFNSPLHRNCDLCWHVRPGWLPEKPCALPRKRSRPGWQMRRMPRTRTYRRSSSVPDGLSYKSSSEYGENEVCKEPSNGVKGGASDSLKHEVNQVATSTPLGLGVTPVDATTDGSYLTDSHHIPGHYQGDEESDLSNVTSGEDEYDGPVKPAVGPASCVVTSILQVEDRDLLPLNPDSGVDTESIALQSQDSLTSVCAAGSQDSGLASESVPSICSLAASCSDLTDSRSAKSAASGDQTRTRSLSEGSVGAHNGPKDVRLSTEMPGSTLRSSIEPCPVDCNSDRTVLTRRNLEEKRRTRVCLTNFQTSAKPGQPHHSEELQQRNLDPAPLRRIKSESSVKSSQGRCDTSSLCSLCLTRPKEASIIHGRTGHQMCCYKCAKRLRRRGKPCPVCRRPIKMIIKNFIV